MVDFGQNIFYALVAEFLVLLTVWLAKGNRRRQVLILSFGTAIAGIIGFGVPIIEKISLETNIPLIDVAPHVTTQPSTERSAQETSMQATVTKETDQAPVIEQMGFLIILLESIANHPMDNLAIPISGQLSFGDVPFRLLPGSKAVFQTQHHLLPSYPTRASLKVEIPNPMAIHVLVNGAYVYKSLQGQTAGKIILRFVNAPSLVSELVVGQNLRENWAYNSGPTPWSGEDEVVTKVTTPSDWISVYEERQSRSGKPAMGYIDMVSIRIPKDHQTSILSEIEFQDDLYDPSLVLYGISVEVAP